ncbi:MAG: adenosylcobinamide-GDP ribazoletransferase [Rhodobacteraceae bacterium]|nr:adenosylcobinamide-GDP ribazoletransferase [Paracoccaceae bacterium]
MISQIDVSPDDIPAALILLTRLPVPVDHAPMAHRAARSAWAYPIVGALIGALAGLLAWVLVAIGLPAGMAAGAGLAALVLLSGALHEDGLADCADAFGGGTTVKQRLKIMKDSRLGAFGGVTLAVAMLMRWAGIEASLHGPELLTLAAVGAVSRLPMAVTMWAMPRARHNGLAAGVGFVPAQAMALAGAVAFAIAVLTCGWAGVAMWVIALAAAVPVCFLAWRRIEGYTGDVLGCIQQVSEIAALAVAAVLI